jgi:hypothetical protein
MHRAFPPAAADLLLVRPVSASNDPRFGIWNALHDGEITIMAREQPDSLIMFVSIPYVRRRIQPLGDSFRLRLGGFRGMAFSYGSGDETYSDLDYVEGFEILEAKSDTMPATIQLAEGTLMLDFDSLEISLDSGQPISAEEVYRAYEEYWDEWSKKAQQV